MLPSPSTRRRSLFAAGLLMTAGAALFLACIGDDPTAKGSAGICETYCTEIAKSCTGADRQYRNDEECRRACALLPEGTEADGKLNTVGCRLRQARAASDRESCVVAGPFGGGSCGSRCEAFCDIVIGNCTGPLAAYGSKSTCLEECQAFDLDPAEGEGPDQVSAGNDTINCRAHHAILALDDQTVHCAHTATASPVCLDRDAGHPSHGGDSGPSDAGLSDN